MSTKLTTEEKQVIDSVPLVFSVSDLEKQILSQYKFALNANEIIEKAEREGYIIWAGEPLMYRRVND